jgi:hypothetical protein
MTFDSDSRSSIRDFQPPRSLTMRKPALILLLACGALAGLRAPGRADEPAGKVSTPVGKTPTPEQERAFAELLTGAVLEGTWQMTHFAPDQEPVLGEPRSERYTIEKAEKTLDEHWIITARVQYADKDVALPVPVRVIWADDTPVITLDSMNLPMLGTYSARVMFHKGFYSGVWYGATYGGTMSGRVTRPPADKPTQAPERQPGENPTPKP